MATAILKKRNYKAKLPNDFFRLISLIRVSDGHHFYIPSNKSILMEITDEVFCVHESEIFFSGNFNKKWLQRQFEKIKEWFIPITYTLTYISLTEETQNRRNFMKELEEKINKMES